MQLIDIEQKIKQQQIDIDILKAQMAALLDELEKFARGWIALHEKDDA